MCKGTVERASPACQPTACPAGTALVQRAPTPLARPCAALPGGAAQPPQNKQRAAGQRRSALPAASSSESLPSSAAWGPSSTSRLRRAGSDTNWLSSRQLLSSTVRADTAMSATWGRVGGGGGSDIGVGRVRVGVGVVRGLVEWVGGGGGRDLLGWAAAWAWACGQPPRCRGCRWSLGSRAAGGPRGLQHTWCITARGGSPLHLHALRAPPPGQRPAPSAPSAAPRRTRPAATARRRAGCCRAGLRAGRGAGDARWLGGGAARCTGLHGGATRWSERSQAATAAPCGVAAWAAAATPVDFTNRAGGPQLLPQGPARPAPVSSVLCRMSRSSLEYQALKSTCRGQAGRGGGTGDAWMLVAYGARRQRPVAGAPSQGAPPAVSGRAAS